MTVTNRDMNALGTIETIEAGDGGNGGNSSDQYNNYGGYPQMSTATARPPVRSPPPKGTPTRPSNTSSNLSTSGRGAGPRRVLGRGACRGSRESTGGVAGRGVSVPRGGRGVANEV